MNAPVCQIDFETRSACNLRRCGTWIYSVDKSTDILCLVWRLPSWEPGRTTLWHPAFPSLGIPEHLDIPELLELFDWVANGGLVEAHYSWFEFCIWANILVVRYGWPEIPLLQWRCSAAKAATHALPRALEDAAAALKLPIQKDMEGSKVMRKMTKPRKSRKKEREQWTREGVKPPKYLWHESADLLQTLVQYCRTDVLTEQALSDALPDLSPNETRMFQMDLRMNAQGFQLDKGAIKIALQLLHREGILLNQELTVLTNKQVRKATQRTKMLTWFQDQGLQIFDTQKATLDSTLVGEERLAPQVRRALEIVRALGRSSTAKYQAMRNWAAKDGRVRGGLLYHGATTGRFSGKGVQPHNFPKGTVKDMDALWIVLKRGQRPEITEQYTGVMEALSNGLRGAITARAKHQLVVADYAAIEARVVLWLAGDEDALDIFRSGRDIYCEMAESIYGYSCTKDDNPTERSMGKIAVLGLGYQMGASKFVDTCASYGITIDDDFGQRVVDTYRDRFWLVKQLWQDQQDAAIQAVQTKRPVGCGYVTWFISGIFLYCRLPSGRLLAYPRPEVKMKAVPWGGERPSLTYMGVDPYSRKWKRQHTYGGMIVENITQAVARDLMAEAMLRCERSGTYQVVLSVHDELVAEAPDEKGSVHEFEQMLTQCPPWAEGLPIEASGWAGFRYRK